MSLADKIFKEMCTDIIENGSTTENQKVRPHWDDGTPAYTIKQFGVVNRYDLRKEFPALTIRRTAIKTAAEEILWIYQRHSNNIHDLKAHIWDEWADKDGSIGKAYGYQIGKEYIHHTEKYNYMDVLANPNEYSMLIYQSALEIRDKMEAARLNRIDVSEPAKYIYKEVSMNQIDAVIYDLKHTPFSRRIITDMWNFEDLHEMNLQPCCYNVTYNVTDEGYDKLILNMVINQRSNDVLAANNWNVCQYAILLMMIAQVCDMIPGQIVHCIADAHIYDRHVDIVKEIIKNEEYDAPKVTLNPDIKDFYQFTTKDITIENYKWASDVKDIPIAI